MAGAAGTILVNFAFSVTFFQTSYSWHFWHQKYSLLKRSIFDFSRESRINDFPPTVRVLVLNLSRQGLLEFHDKNVEKCHIATFRYEHGSVRTLHFKNEMCAIRTPSIEAL